MGRPSPHPSGSVFNIINISLKTLMVLMNRFSGYSLRGNDKIGFLLTVLGKRNTAREKGQLNF